MQIDGAQTIDGVPILKVRDWMKGNGTSSRSFLAACFHRWEPTRRKSVECVNRKASALLKALLELGYISAKEKLGTDEVQYYKLTGLGKEFVRASGARRLKRETVTQALDDFKIRLAEVNASPRFLVRVTRAVLYGSYLRGEETVGDLDLAADYESKITGEDPIAVLQEYFDKSGRTARTFYDYMIWPELEVKLFLKNRKRTISLHSFHDLLEMPKAANFSYEVLLGDPEQIEADLISAETMKEDEEPGTDTGEL
jgi:predicted nucleotidyltransferase